jgi:UDP-2,3-diacylglucosamine hydrolase
MSDPAAPALSPDSPVAIVCGGGQFPGAVAEAVMRRGRRVFLFPVRGWADPDVAERYPHQWIALGQLAAGFRRAHAEGCRDVVLIGNLLRPSIWQLRFDVRTLLALPRIIRAFKGGDNHLLSGVARILEDNGFRLIGAHEVAPEILIPAGTLGGIRPNDQDRADIARGLSLVAAIGPFDIGQAVVVANNQVLAVEAAEGTDAMLERVAALRREGRIRLPSRTGVLVKGPKPGQDRRFDLPSIGPRTVETAAAAGLAGIAVEGAGAITADLQAMTRAADAAGLFFVGAPAARPDAPP